MSQSPIDNTLTPEGTVVDLSQDPRVVGLESMLRDVSAVKDPAKMLQAFGPWIGQRFPRDAFISVSKRDLPQGKYKLTRVISSTANPRNTLRDAPPRDPWSEWLSLTTYEGGLIGRIIAQNSPMIFTNVDFTQDPVLGRVLGQDAKHLRAVSAIPSYDDGEALNWSLSFHDKDVWDDLDSFIAGLLDVNLMGTATRNLVFRKQAESLNTKLLEQFEQIAKIQRQLLPDHRPDLKGLTLSTSYLTSNIAGGDYYDYFQGDDDRIGIVIADVSGHGPGAATVMAMLRTIIYCYDDIAESRDRVDPDVSRFAWYCNKKLVQANLNGEFATAFFCIIDPRDGTLSWTRCGHNPPLLRRADGTIEQIESAATLPLGIVDGIDFESDSCVMHPGDTLILYTDGITEATATRPAHEFSMHQNVRDTRAEQFGVQRMIDSLDTCSGNPECAIDHIHRALFKFTNRLDRDDDQTLVVIQRNPEQGPS
jgi:sigma-B regulation protein RsbU (phosphoserine phosphatase)